MGATYPLEPENYKFYWENKSVSVNEGEDIKNLRGAMLNFLNKNINGK